MPHIVITILCSARSVLSFGHMCHEIQGLSHSDKVNMISEVRTADKLHVSLRKDMLESIQCCWQVYACTT